MDITVTSEVFSEGEVIPEKYTCDDRDISPPLSWTGVPEEARSLVLIFDDPDAPAGTWVHWVVFDIPPDTSGLDEGIPPDESLADSSRQGVNDFGDFGYGGPCPPSGTHRYYFKLYALDKVLELSGRVTKDTLLKDMKGHILAEGQLMGKYSRHHGGE
jgi:hypothetical protein